MVVFSTDGKVTERGPFAVMTLKHGVSILNLGLDRSHAAEYRVSHVAYQRRTLLYMARERLTRAAWYHKSRSDEKVL